MKILFCRHYSNPLNKFVRKLRKREEFGSGSVPLTNGSGSGRPNIGHNIINFVSPYYRIGVGMVVKVALSACLKSCSKFTADIYYINKMWYGSLYIRNSISLKADTNLLVRCLRKTFMPVGQFSTRRDTE